MLLLCTDQSVLNLLVHMGWFHGQDEAKLGPGNEISVLSLEEPLETSTALG